MTDRGDADIEGTERTEPHRVAEWESRRETYLFERDERPTSAARERTELIADPLGEMYGSPVM